MTRSSNAQRGITIMRRSGEAAGRQYLLDHQNPDMGPTTARSSGTLILEDGSSVAITQEHYAFRWTQNEHEFSMTYPTGPETYPWPEQPSPATQGAIACYRLVERYEDIIRDDLALEPIGSAQCANK